PDAGAVPFRQRIRPGMVVSWTPPAEYAAFAQAGKAYAMVMCPAQAAGARARDVLGNRVADKVITNESEGGGDSNRSGGDADENNAYLCTVVMPSLPPGSYVISPWRQVVVKAEEMEAEVFLEWDEATRYYYMTV